MKKKAGLIFLVIFTLLQAATCAVNLIYQHNTSVDIHWTIFPISGHGICYPLFIFTLLLTAGTAYVVLHKKRV